MTERGLRSGEVRGRLTVFWWMGLEINYLAAHGEQERGIDRILMTRLCIGQMSYEVDG